MRIVAGQRGRKFTPVTASGVVHSDFYEGSTSNRFNAWLEAASTIGDGRKMFSHEASLKDGHLIRTQFAYSPFLNFESGLF